MDWKRSSPGPTSGQKKQVQKLGLVMVVAAIALAATVLYFASQHEFSPSQAATAIGCHECVSGVSFPFVCTNWGPVYPDPAAPT